MAYYRDDAVTLYNGDCAYILAGLEVKANLILTSPPYDNLRDYGGDGFDFERVADACVNALADGGVLVWNVADTTIDGARQLSSHKAVIYFVERCDLMLHDTIIYHKPTSTGKTYPNRHWNAWEYMHIFSKGKHRTFDIDVPTVKGGIKTSAKTMRNRDGTLGRRNDYIVPHVVPRSNIWAYNVGWRHSAPDFLDAHEHPAIMPIALAKDHIRTWTNPGDLVIDPMAGSGTTIRAAKDLNRRAIGVEIHEPYCELATRRMAQSVLPIAEASSLPYNSLFVGVGVGALGCGVYVGVGVFVGLGVFVAVAVAVGVCVATVTLCWADASAVLLFVRFNSAFIVFVPDAHA